MAEVFFSGVTRRPTYKKGEKLLDMWDYRVVIHLAVVMTSSFEYRFELLRLFTISNALTVITFRVVCSALIVYPWLLSCLLIGQYTKQHFINLVHAVPFYKGALYLHLAVLPILFAFHDWHPSIIKQVENIFNHDQDLWNRCEEQLAANFEEERASCGPNNQINYTTWCYFQGTDMLVQPTQIPEDIRRPIYGIITTFFVLYVLNNYRFFLKMVKFLTGYYLALVAIPLAFALIVVSPELVIKHLMHQAPNSFGENFYQFILCFEYEICALCTNTPSFILLGNQLPARQIPVNTVIRIIISQILVSFVCYIYLITNATVVAAIYKVPVDCLLTRNTFESEFTLRQASTFMIFKDQTILCRYIYIVYLTQYLVTQLVYITTHVMILHIMLCSAVNTIPSKKYLYAASLLFLTVLMHFTSYVISLSEYFFSMLEDVYEITVMTLACAFTIAILFLYGSSEIDKDVTFLYTDGLGPITKHLMNLLPLCTLGFTVYRFQEIVGIVTNVYKELYLILIIFLPTIYTVASMIYSVIRAFANKHVAKAFEPDPLWGPWSPPGEALNIERRNYFPEKATKFEGNYYECNHNCWLNNRIIHADIEECDKVYKQVVIEIEDCNLSMAYPNIFQEFNHVLLPFQTHFTNSPTSRKRRKSSTSKESDSITTMPQRAKGIFF